MAIPGPTWNSTTLIRRACAGLVGIAACAVILTFQGCGSGPADPPECSTGTMVQPVTLQLVASGLVAPVGMAVPGDGSGRLFVLEQVGQIRIIDAAGTLLPDPFLDLSERMVEIGIAFSEDVVFDERGLLGLAFHPDYADNGRFFVFYTAPKGPDDPEDFNAQNIVAEFRVSADDPNRADGASERQLLEIDKPQFNHNGGQLAFGPDGYLYIAVGDGGAGNDDGVGHTPDTGNAQDTTNLLGAILRIDVDTGEPYGIPSDNPFVDDPDARPEIYAFGLRNPWRFSFDSGGRLFAADVGQDLFEEVNIVTRGGNYGWRVREGLHCFDLDDPATPPADCADTGAAGEALIDPILEYPHTGMQQPFGISITGGFLYEGQTVPCLQGAYVFGDWSTGFTAPDGSLYAAEEGADGQWVIRELQVNGARLGRYVTSFGRDEQGELYVMTSANLGPTGTTGQVHRIGAAP